MINSIGGVVIMVSDQAQAVKFYAEKMGFDIRLNVPFLEESGLRLLRRF